MRLPPALAVLALAACAADPVPHDDGPNPAGFVGRWVRFRPDGQWGDTMRFHADGAISGSAGYPVPANLRWEVRRDSVAGAQFCAGVSGDGFCRGYRLAPDSLLLLGGPNGDTRFRRVP